MSVLESVVFRLGMIIAIAWASSGITRADMIWQSPVTISGDSDVSTLGVSLRAWGMSSATVNGVSFSSLSSFSPTNSQTGGSGFGGSSTVYNALSDQYKVLLGSAVYNASGTGFENTAGRMAIDLTGLTAGKIYEFQAFVNDSRNSTGDFNSGRWNIFDSGAGTSQSQSVFQPYLPSTSNIGQYIKGTFTANSTSQLIRISGNATTGPPTSLINAYQLRDITAVPEPSSLLLLASISGVGFLLMRRMFNPRSGSTP